MGSGAGDMGGNGGAGTQSHRGWRGSVRPTMGSLEHLPSVREKVQWTRTPSNVQKDRLEQEQEELRGGVGV